MIVLSLAAAAMATGCSYYIDWPDAAAETRTSRDGSLTKAFKIGRVQRPNYFQRLEGDRVVELSFDDDSNGTVDETVRLAPDATLPNCAVILDGVPFDVVRSLYDEGHFRLFAPPVRVVSVFPSMTDLALSRIVRSKPCVAAQALYFDRDKNRLSNGNDVYLNGKNAPWRENVRYCAPQNIAINAYLNPPYVFSVELRGLYETFEKAGAGIAFGYSVGTAGLGTRGGENAIRTYLLEIEKLCERITYERRGRVRFTILADHGHTLRQCRRVSFRQALTDAGFRVGKSIERPNDVVPIEYGIVTYAQFHTDRARDVAAVLVRQPSVDLVTFRDADSVVVQKKDSIAMIRRRPGGFTYDASGGDPLSLSRIIDSLREAGHVANDGTIEDRPLFDATVSHHYPDPLHRLWSCFDDLVERPGDVIASLKPEFCHGSKFFHFFVDPVASTHGGLDYENSVTFLLTNAAGSPLPAACRVDDVIDLLAPSTAAPTNN